MRAAILTPDHRVSMEDVDGPVPNQDQVVVSPVVVGLCGSDVSYATKGANGSFSQREPMILGHEVCARLLEDTEVQGTVRKAGTLVAVHPLWPSPLAGESTVRPEHARDVGSFLGSASTHPHTPGGLATRMAIRPQQLRILPDDLTAERAVLAEPLAVVLHAFGRLDLDLTRRRLLICGAGPIGLLCAVVAVARGAREITVTDLHTQPLAMARRLGASSTLQVPSQRPEPQTFDVAIEATGVIASLTLAVDALAPEGHLLQLGMLPQTANPITLAAIVTKELTVVGTHRFTGELDDALTFLSGHPQCAEVVTHRFPLSDTAEALRFAADPATASKVIIHVEAGP